jgi:hypothetical protein
MIVGTTGHAQDHLLTNPTLIFGPLGVVLPAMVIFTEQHRRPSLTAHQARRKGTRESAPTGFQPGPRSLSHNPGGGAVSSICVGRSESAEGPAL